MIKKQQKWIALLVTLTFVGLLQVSTMPLAADNIMEQISSANSEQAPNFVEAIGHNTSPAKKKSILPIVLIGVGVVAVAAVLFLVVLKTNYNPVGTWSGPMSTQGTSENWTGTVVFTGDKKTGTTLYSGGGDESEVGTYNVDGKNITFTITNYNITLTGTFESKDVMSGTWQRDSGDSAKGLWKLVRGGTTAQIQVPQDLAGANSRHFQ